MNLLPQYNATQLQEVPTWPGTFGATGSGTRVTGLDVTERNWLDTTLSKSQCKIILFFLDAITA